MRRLGVGSWISRELWDDSQSLPVMLAYLTYGAKWGDGIVIRPVKRR